MKKVFSKNAVDLLKKLLVRKVIKIIFNYLYFQAHKRLGYSDQDAEEIKEHPFFADIDWKKLAKRQVKPPWKPKITHDKDLRHFDKVHKLI